MKNRSLNLIVNEIRATLKREVADVIKIGGLLTEAKAQLDHGEWLRWLEKEFSLTDRSARNYMTAYGFAKSETVSDLKLRVSALYLLASDDNISPKEKRVILRVAKTQWVGETRIRQILWNLRDKEERRRQPAPEPDPPLDEDDADGQLDAKLHLKNRCRRHRRGYRRRHHRYRSTCT